MSENQTHDPTNCTQVCKNSDVLHFGLLNIQGLATSTTDKIHNGELIDIIKKHDIIMFTESWTNELSDIDICGYDHYDLHRKRKSKNAKRDSGGMIIYYKQELNNYVNFVKSDSDDIMWLKLSGDILPSGVDLYVCLLYAVPAGSSHNVYIETDVYDRFLLSLAEILNTNDGNCDIMVAGDFNVHTQVLEDWIVEDNPEYLPVSDSYECDCNLSIRSNQDIKPVNKYGIKLIELCHTTGLRIVNGRVGNDNGIGKFTYFDRHGGSVLDYVLVNEHLLYEIQCFDVYDQSVLSDHCLISYSINSCVNNVYKDTDYDEASSVKFYKWDVNKEKIYMDNLKSHNVQENLNTMCNLTTENITCNMVDELVKKFTNVVCEVADPLFSKTKKLNRVENVSKLPQWMCVDCKNLRKIFYSNVQMLKRNNNDINRKNMSKARSNYNKHIKNCRKKYCKNKTDELVSFNNKDQKQFWKLLKGNPVRCVPKITLNEYYDFFEKVSNPDINTDMNEDVNNYIARFENQELNIMFSELNEPITVAEVVKAITKLNRGKSAGCDLLLNLISYIVPIFNVILNSGEGLVYGTG